jgi:hypothetical protein
MSVVSPETARYCQSVLKRPLIYVALALCALVVAAAASAQSGGRVTLRIYDPTGHSHTQVTLAGIVRRQTHVTHVGNLPTGTLGIVFTKAGRTDFCKLTRALARRGARHHNHHELSAFEVNGHIYARPSIDYRVAPNGLCVPALAVQLKLATTRRLARLLR